MGGRLVLEVYIIIYSGSCYIYIYIYMCVCVTYIVTKPKEMINVLKYSCFFFEYLPRFSSTETTINEEFQRINHNRGERGNPLFLPCLMRINSKFVCGSSCCVKTSLKGADGQFTSVSVMEVAIKMPSPHSTAFS